MTKPRIVIPITIQFSVRYAIRTGFLEMMAKYAQPIVLIGWRDQSLTTELQESGVEVYQLPLSEYGADYSRIKHRLDLWHREIIQSPTSDIDKYRTEQLSPPTYRSRLRDALLNISMFIPKTQSLLLNRFQSALNTHTNLDTFLRFLREIRADAVLSLTPFLPQEHLLLCAGKKLGLRMCTSILSFDNLTSRGWIPVVFDAYFLWNNYNMSELMRAYPESVSSTRVIVGAPQFDFYWNQDYVWDEQIWRQRLRIPTARPVILFGAGHRMIVPHEPHWLQQLDEAIEASEIPDKPVILFRRHPNDPMERWTPILKKSRHVIHDDPWQMADNRQAFTNIRREDIERLASTLAHSLVHINASSTMTVDGSIFDRPQIGPAYDDRPGKPYEKLTRELYQREHFLPITRSGGLEIVSSRNQMIEALRASIHDPSARSEGRKRIVKEICTYDDGLCTRRLDQALRKFLETGI